MCDVGTGKAELLVIERKTHFILKQKFMNSTVIEFYLKLFCSFLSFTESTLSLHLNEFRKILLSSFFESG